MENDDEYEHINSTSVHVNMLAGAIAGITEHSVMFPFDSIKVFRHLINHTDPNATIIFTTSSAVLWRGVQSVLLGAGPAHALSFATYEHFKLVFSQNQPGHQVFAHGMAGACATIAHDGFMTPFDVIKQRMQVSKYPGVFSCVMDTFKAEGLAAFYVSYPITILMSIPFQSIHFATYEAMKLNLNPSHEYNPYAHILSGGIAGATASLFTQPLDVVKTLLQTKGVSTDAAVRNVDGFVNGFKLIHQRNGFKGLFRGLQPRLFTNIPATAICWTTYEFIKMCISEPQIKQETKLLRILS